MPRGETAERSLFSLQLSCTLNNLQVSDGCVSPSKDVQDRPIVGSVVGCQALDHLRTRSGKLESLNTSFSSSYPISRGPSGKSDAARLCENSEDFDHFAERTT